MAHEPELRSLPSVEELARRLDGVPHAVAVRVARAALGAEREAIQAGGTGPHNLVSDALARANDLLQPSLRRVLNATGVVLHTNLGRAPLADPATDAITEAARGYSNLEYDLGSGERGSRQDHVASLLAELAGADDALVVNNCAGAVLLAAAALASARELIVSRGQLIEIGDSFRVPEVIEQSGARLVEVGTTNRTRIEDYRRAISDDTGAVLRAHPSNFRSLGFVEEVTMTALCSLGPPVIDDVGSGLFAEDLPTLHGEPAVRESVAAGCAVVCFSGDKLLGGPQAGLMVGRSHAIEQCRSHPLARALRIDKLSLAGLEATLRLYLDPGNPQAQIPILRMLATDADQLRDRAEAMRDRLTAAGVGTTVIESVAKVGGGALPLVELEGPACAIEPRPRSADQLAKRLREASPPVICRVREGKVLLDPRTLSDDEARLAAEAAIAAMR